MSDLLQQIAALAPEKRALLLTRFDKKKKDAGTAPAIGRRPPGVTEMPLSFAQERLWFLDQLEPENRGYNICRAFELEGLLNRTALKESLDIIAQRHEVLRASVISVQGRPAQSIRAEMSAPLVFIDLSIHPDSSDELKRTIDSECRHVFKLAVGPLWRTVLVRLSPTRHVLLLVVHHIVFDGASMGIFLQNLSGLYRERCGGSNKLHSGLAIGYGDYALWQREHLRGATLHRLTSYWKRQLAGAPLEIELPLDRPRPEIAGHRGGIEHLELPDSLVAGLQNLTRQHSSTPFMSILAAFTALLTQWSGQEEVLIGTPVSGRSKAETEGVIGLFVNTMVIRGNAAGDPSFTELLARARATALDAYSNQDLPFDRLVEALNPLRAPGRPPVFQVMLSMHSEVAADPEFEGLTVRRYELPRQTSLFDLEMVVAHSGGTLAIDLEYDSDLFDAFTIRRLLTRFSNLLEKAVARPDERLSALLELPDEERDVVLGWSRRPRSGVRERLIHELFEEAAAATPDAPAVECEGKQWTYLELDRHANQVAHYLRAKGVTPERCVGVCVERSLQTLAVVLGIWKAGAAYLPIDPSLPPSRVDFLLRDTQTLLMVSDGRAIERLSKSITATIVSVDREWEEIVHQPSQKPAIAATHRNLAYVIYTSGSTGVPKGVAVEHDAAALHLSTIGKDFGYRPGDRVLEFASLSFDVSIEQMITPLLYGTTLILENNTLWDQVEFPGVVRRLRLTVINIPPAYWMQLVLDESLNGFGALRLVIVGGDTVPPHVVRRWQSNPVKKPVLLNAYGPTETVITAALYQIPEQADGIELQRVPIGQALSNRTAYVLDERRNLTPVGVWGELHFGGVLLARGYLGEPALTSERFIPDPYGGAGERLYRSGDMARYRADGVLEFLGRKDGQVKIRGYRIELGEVERAVQEQPFVLHTAVVAKQRLGGERYLAAYVELTAGAPLDAVERVRVGVRVRLPEYMCPGVFVVLASFPRTGSGKLDRRSLPEPEAMESAGGYTAPRTTGEATLAGIWATVLGVERVSVTANFFEIGGDSIIGIQIVARARQAGIGISPRQLFQHQTIAELAAAAPQRPGRQTAEDAGETGELPLTPIQHLFFATSTDNLHHFNQAFLFEVREEIRPELLEKALGKLVAQHDALRLRFRRTAEGWRQRYAAVRESPVRLERREIAEGENWDGALRKTIAEAHKSLNIERGPLVRMTWFDLGERGRRLHVVIHHLAVDGVSWRILAEDLETIYRELAEGEETKGLVRTSSYGQWAKGLAGYASGTALEKELGYWRREQERVVEAFVADMPLGENTVRAESRLERVLEAGETRRLLSEAGKAYHTQVMELLLSAMAEGLHGWRGHRRVRVELEGHGREEVLEGVDLTRTVGWFTSVYPVVLEWREGEREGDRIGRVKEQMRGIPNKGLGYGILRYLKAGSGLEGECALVMNYLGQFDGAIGREAWLPAAREGSGPGVGEGRHRGAEMELNAMVIEGRLQMAWSYSGERWRRETVEALADAFEDSLHALIDHCLSPQPGQIAAALFDLDNDDLDHMMHQLRAVAR